MRMGQRIVEFASLVLTALAVIPALAHLIELPNKLRLSQKEYVTAQRLYRGWSYVAMATVGNALLATLALSVAADNGASLAFALVAFAFICAAEAVFLVFTLPVNRVTANWSFAPSNWRALRNQWEYSHATAAAFGLCAVLGVILSVVSA